MATSRKRKRLLDAYRFAGFRPLEDVRGMFGDSAVRVVTLVRRSKNRLQGVRANALWLVRPHDAASAGSVQWQRAGLSGTGSPASSLPMLQQGETRADRLPCRQSAIRSEAVRLHAAENLINMRFLPTLFHEDPI